MLPAQPIEGWARRHSSYAVAIARSVITALRDDGPLSAVRVHTVIKRANIGADVEKASPSFNINDGAERVWNFMRQDFASIIREDDQGLFYIDPELREAYSPSGGFTIQIPEREELDLARTTGRREALLRRWVTCQPFKNAWKDGILKHDDDEVVALADFISAIGYVSDPIIKDQDGTIIEGHLRAAALTKLGIDVDRYSKTIVFASDMHRLAWILTANYRGGKWPTALRDEVIRMVNATLRGTGVKMQWPQDIKIILGSVPSTVVTQEQENEEDSPPTPPKKAPRALAYPRSFPSYRPVPYDSVGIDVSAYKDDGSKARLIRRVLQNPGTWVPKTEGKYGSKDVCWHFRRSMWFRFNGQAYLWVPDRLKTTQQTHAAPEQNWSSFRIRPLTFQEAHQFHSMLPTFDPKKKRDWTQEAYDAEYGPLYELYERLVKETWKTWGHEGDEPC